MNASKKENINNTPVEEKKAVKSVAKKTVQNKSAEKLAELELRLRKVEERMGL